MSKVYDNDDFKRMTLPEIITKHQQLHADNPQGWAIICVGTKRCSYLAFAKDDFIYDETKIHISGTKQEAADLMTRSTACRNLWKHIRIIPVRGDIVDVKGGMLPTVDGY